MIIKSRFMTGFDSDYVPGWDCHGLPIEHQVDKNWRKKLHMSSPEIRRHCRAYAEKFIDIQREEFKRLGVLGEWEILNLTMALPVSGHYCQGTRRFLCEWGRVPGKKPVYWCASCVPHWLRQKWSTWILPLLPSMCGFPRGRISPSGSPNSKVNGVRADLDHHSVDDPRQLGDCRPSG